MSQSQDDIDVVLAANASVVADAERALSGSGFMSEIRSVRAAGEARRAERREKSEAQRAQSEKDRRQRAQSLLKR